MLNKSLKKDEGKHRVENIFVCHSNFNVIFNEKICTWYIFNDYDIATVFLFLTNRSERIGLMEDAEEMRREQEELLQKRKRGSGHGGGGGTTKKFKS